MHRVSEQVGGGGGPRAAVPRSAHSAFLLRAAGLTLCARSLTQSRLTVTLHVFTLTRSVASDSLSPCVFLRSLTQSCLTLRDPVDGSPPGSSVHGILQARHWSGFPHPSPGDLPDPGI